MKGIESFLQGFAIPYSTVDQSVASSIYKPRDPFTNKGSFGHALLIAGSFGKMGAALLAARGCLHGGAGLLTAHIPACGYTIMQTAIPEVMVSVDPNEKISTRIDDPLDKYAVVGIGPGIGTDAKTRGLLAAVFEGFKKPMLIDADALNILSASPNLLSKIPSLSILTPHPKEFDRLFGQQPDEFARFSTAVVQAKKLNVIVVVKGHFTAVAMPDGTLSFNTTGNAGMAKGGSGDALSGIITALLSQGYPPVSAARLGIYLHGAAGDLAAARFSQEAMTPGNLIDCLGDAFLALSRAVPGQQF